jgi:hypothetical protein
MAARCCSLRSCVSKIITAYPARAIACWTTRSWRAVFGLVQSVTTRPIVREVRRSSERASPFGR